MPPFRKRLSTVKPTKQEKPDDMPVKPALTEFACCTCGKQLTTRHHVSNYRGITYRYCWKKRSCYDGMIKQKNADAKAPVAPPPAPVQVIASPAALDIGTMDDATVPTREVQDHHD